MRALRIGIAGIAVLPFLVAARGAAAPGSHGRCAMPSAIVAPSLPAPVSVTTTCGVYELGRDGRIAHVSTAATSYPKGTEWWPASGVWLRSAHGELVVGRGKRTLWRSHERFSRVYDVGPFEIARHELVFSSGYPARNLYVAPLGGRERVVARHELPLGWTQGGFYTWGPAHHRLELRRLDGAFRKTIEPTVFAYAYGDRGLWIVRNGSLLRADGARVRRVASLEPLGLSAARHIQVMPLGRLVGLETARRLVVLRAEGSLFASTPLTWGTAAVDGVSASPVANRAGSVVAFATTSGNAGYTSRGTETIWALQAHDSGARPVRIERGLRWPTCVSGAALSWHDGWLLYSSNGGKVALVDWLSGRQIDLTPAIRALPGGRPNHSALDINVSWG